MTETQKVRQWAAGEGIDVPARGAVPQRVRAAYYAAHPDETPDGWVAPLTREEVDEEDAGPPEDIGLVMPADAPDSDAGEPGRPARYEAVPDGPEPASDDRGPAHARKDWRRPAAPRGAATPGRVSSKIRTDITAKISFALMVPGTIWKARDPLCGSVFVEQIPDTADAFADIVCDSADLIAFFTGPGGTFMKALKVGAALMPVAQVVMAHHVYHTVEEVPEDAQQPYADVAA